ncbi:MAG: TonB-dependent receptor [Chitinophagaceae bacterium]|nr:TonB-dependent receptor [Chitinophagaceae bacterium]
MRRFFILCMLLMFSSVVAFSQTKRITGTVMGQEGQPLPDVSVVVKGTQTGTVTNAEGYYAIDVKPGATVLVFSSVGSETQEVVIGNQTVINVALIQSVGELQEVVINVPYGTVKKTSFTGSENTVTAQTLSAKPVTSVTKALDGLVPGVMMTNGGGAPGSGASMLIRGIGSVSASSSPLYVLNGVPYDGSITSLNTDEIESLTILKDATAAALYGSRAANGVVMITTKKGMRGAPVTRISYQQGFMTRGIPEYDRVGPKDYYELFWEAYKNNYKAQGNSDAQAGIMASNVLTGPSGLIYNAYNVPGNQLVDPVTGKLNPSAQLLWQDSWEDALFRTALRTNANFNVSGASDRVNYFFGAGYLNEEGIVRFSGYERFNMRLNVNMDATSWFKTGLNLDGAMSTNKNVPSGGTATTNPFYFTRQMGPIYPVWQRDLATGAFVTDPLTGKPMLDWGTPEQMGTRPYAGRANLLGSLALDDRSSRGFNGNANTYAEIKFLRDFSFKTTVGVNFFSSNGTNYQNNQYGDAAPSTPGGPDGGRSTKSNTRQVSLTANQVLTWSRTMDKHNVTALAGHENYRWKQNYLAGYMSGFVFPGQTELNNGATAFNPPTSYENNETMESYFGSVNYTYDNKYLLSGSYRTDGSSIFAADKRWGNFYSVGLGWRISQEKFMQNIPWLNELKFKASYGEQGNNAIGQLYAYRAYYYADGTGSYVPPQSLENPDILWEKNQTTNVGIEYSVLKRRLSGSFEWFNRVSDNLLFQVPLPPSLGTFIWQNIGTMKNTGIEVQLSGVPVKTRDFDWRIDFNLTHFKNKITKLPPNQRENGIVSGTKKLMEGHSIYDFWLREYAGVDASTGDALYYKDVLDANGKETGERTVTNVYNQGTFYYHGSSIPDVFGGITNTFNYKGIGLSVHLVYSYGGLFYDGNYASLMHRGSAGTAWSVDILDRWKKPGDVTTVPRIQNAIAGQDGVSTRWLFDGSYLNVKSVSLSYSLPHDVVDRMYLGGLDFFVNADNIWLFSAHKGMDPQRSFAGTSDWSYTPYRTISVGINAKLK